MKPLCLFLMLFCAEWRRMPGVRDVGEIPVESHDEYGAYRNWTYTFQNKIYNVEARFMGTQNGVLVLGTDHKKKGVRNTDTKYMALHEIPVASLSTPDKKWVKDEAARRAKDKKPKKDAPENKKPAPKKKDAAKPNANKLDTTDKPKNSIGIVKDCSSSEIRKCLISAFTTGMEERKGDLSSRIIPPVDRAQPAEMRQPRRAGV